MCCRFHVNTRFGFRLCRRGSKTAIHCHETIINTFLLILLLLPLLRFVHVLLMILGFRREIFLRGSKVLPEILASLAHNSDVRSLYTTNVFQLLVHVNETVIQL